MLVARSTNFAPLRRIIFVGEAALGGHSSEHPAARPGADVVVCERLWQPGAPMSDPTLRRPGWARQRDEGEVLVLSFSPPTFTLEIDGKPTLVFQTKWQGDADRIVSRLGEVSLGRIKSL